MHLRVRNPPLELGKPMPGELGPWLGRIRRDRERRDGDPPQQRRPIDVPLLPIGHRRENAIRGPGQRGSEHLQPRRIPIHIGRHLSHNLRNRQPGQSPLPPHHVPHRRPVLRKQHRRINDNDPSQRPIPVRSGVQRDIRTQRMPEKIDLGVPTPLKNCKRTQHIVRIVREAVPTRRPGTQPMPPEIKTVNSPLPREQLTERSETPPRLEDAVQYHQRWQCGRGVLPYLGVQAHPAGGQIHRSRLGHRAGELFTCHPASLARRGCTRVITPAP